MTAVAAPPAAAEAAAEPRLSGAPTAILRAGGMALVGIVVLAAALRFSTLGIQSFSDDELFTAWLTKMSFGHMVTTVPRTEATPHLYYVLAWLFAQPLGTGEVGLRILPALLGTLTVPLIYVAGAIVASRRIALAAAAFAAVNPFLVWYSQEARAFSLAVFLTALWLVFLLSFMRSGRSGPLVGWALASAAALASHYFAAFLVVAGAVWLLLAGPGDRRRRALAVAVPAAAGVALLPLLIHQRSTVPDPGGIGSQTLAERVVATPKNFLVGYSIPFETVALVAAGLFAAVALVLAWRRSRRAAAIAAGLCAAGLLIPLALAVAGFDYFSSRPLIVVLVPVALLLGCGFAAGRLGYAALCGICIVSIATVVGIAADSRYQRRDWRAAATALGPPRSDRVLVFSPGFANTGPFGVYYGPSNVFYAGAPRVREVVVVALAEDKGFGPGAPAPPPGAAPRPPAGFHRTEEITTSTYRLIRFAARRPTTVSAAQLRALALTTPNALVWQRARHG